MKKSLFIFMIFMLLSHFGLVSISQCKTPPRVPIKKIMAHPNRYDGKLVELVGILKTAHYGVFLQSATSDGIIKLRLGLTEQKDDTQIIKDSLYTQLCELSKKIDLPGDPLHEYEVKIWGRISVLKENGKPAKKFIPLIEWPEEVIALRVLSITDLGVKKEVQ